MSDSTSSDASSVNTFDSSTSLSPYSVTSHVAPSAFMFGNRCRCTRVIGCNLAPGRGDTTRIGGDV
jgi:hypothetical protein